MAGEPGGDDFFLRIVVVNPALLNQERESALAAVCIAVWVDEVDGMLGK